jgi:hypothetical protein
MKMHLYEIEGIFFLYRGSTVIEMNDQVLSITEPIRRALLPGITTESVCLRRPSSERIYGSAVSQARGVIDEPRSKK